VRLIIIETRSKAEKLKELEAIIAEVYALKEQKPETLLSKRELKK